MRPAPPSSTFNSSGVPQPPSRFAFWRRRNRAEIQAEAVRRWGIESRPFEPAPPASGPVFAHTVAVGAPDQPGRSLGSLLATTTLVLYIGRDVSMLPGLDRRIQRRAATLGPGVALLCVRDRTAIAIPGSYVDLDDRFRELEGISGPPALISLDAEGHVFDVQSDTDALLDWLWNDPRPRSRRA